MTNPHIIIDSTHPIKTIKYSFAQIPFGKIIIASTQYGICSIAFYTSPQQAVDELKRYFPDTSIQEGKLDPKLLSYFQNTQDTSISIRLHLCATEFQVRVWQALLAIPFGHMSTYGEIARQIGKPKASRAVGTAIGNNPIAILIPCHRVIQFSGKLGGYKWGIEQKARIIEWERKLHNNVI